VKTRADAWERGIAGVVRPRCGRLLAAAALCLAIPAARGQGATSSIATASPEPPPSASDAEVPALFQPGACQAGGWSITPQFGVAAGFNSNLRLQSSDEVASPFVALLPGLSAERREGDDSTQLAWRSEWTRFTRSPADDTLNTELSSSALRVLGDRTAMTWNLALQDWHDAIGLATAGQVAQTPDHFHAAALGAILRHDAGDAAQHRFELEPTLSTKHYLNHREVTAEADADTASLVGRYLRLLATGVRAGPELREIRTHYPAGSEDLSDVDTRELATLKWDPTATSAGAISMGAQQRRFDALRPAYQGVTWQADTQWQVGRSTVLSVGTRREAREAPGEDVDEVVDRHLEAGLAYDPSSRWHATFTVSMGTDRYVHSPVSRDDRVRSAELAIHSDLTRRLRLSLNLGCAQRHSELSAFDFTRWLGSLELSAGL